MSELNTDVYFSLGSNLGDRLVYLKYGVAQLKKKLTLIETSPVYETESWGYVDSQPYLNIVAHYQTSVSPVEIIKEIGIIERKAGRESHTKDMTKTYEARTLDIDILFYGNIIFKNSVLNIPHPRLHLRNFVLNPFADIAPEFIHPVLGRSMRDLKKESLDTSKIRCIAQRL